VLGPSEIPLKNVEVRVKMLKELGVQNEYDPVITADIEGPNARARRIDDQLSRETPALSNVKPAVRLTTAILAFSFGGLRRGDAADTETLPPGVTEAELLAACVGPDLDNITATAVLSELRNACLYLHYDGVHYCFKKEPNDLSALRTAIVRGVGAGLFAWYSGPFPLLGTDGKLQVNRERVTLGAALSEDEIDFDSGYLIVPAALPEAQQPPSIPGLIDEPPIIAEPSRAGSVSQNQPAAGQRRTAFSMKFSATRHQIFKAFEAIANLADGSDQGELTIQIEATKAAGYDPTWLRNAVEEPLDEADVERK
jgi:hypothetical protein